MGINDEEIYPWLKDEKNFIREAINCGKYVLGICLGAQLIANALGAKVYKNEYKEIGWFPVLETEESKKSGIFDNFPHEFDPFHWHGDTYDIPAGATLIAGSEGCRNQAFLYEKRVVGFQFHIESTTNSIKKLIENCSHEIVEGRYIQSRKEMLEGADKKTGKVNKILFEFLNRFII